MSGKRSSVEALARALGIALPYTYYDPPACAKKDSEKDQKDKEIKGDTKNE